MFLISFCAALNVISSIFFYNFLCSIYRVVLIECISYQTVSTIFFMKHNLQTLIVHMNTSVVVTVRPHTFQDELTGDK